MRVIPFSYWGGVKKANAIEVTIPGSQIVGGPHTGFEVYFPLSHTGLAAPSMQSWWDQVKPGGINIRIAKYDKSGFYPRAVRGVDVNLKKGIVWFKVTDQLEFPYTFRFLLVADAAMVTDFNVTDPEGRNAVFSSFRSFWDFEDDPQGSAPQLTDLTGNGNDGTVVGNISAGTGKTGQSWSVNDANSGIRVPGFDWIDTSLNNFRYPRYREYSAWYKSANYGDAGGIICYSHRNGLRYNTNGQVFGINTRTGTAAIVIVDNNNTFDGKWHQAMTQRNYLPGPKTVTELSVDGSPFSSANHNEGNQDRYDQYFAIGAFCLINSSSIHPGSGLQGELSLAWYNYDYSTATTNQSLSDTRYANQNDPESFFQIGNLVTL